MTHYTWLDLNSSPSIVDPDLPWAMITTAAGKVPLPPKVKEGPPAAAAPRHVNDPSSIVTKLHALILFLAGETPRCCRRDHVCEVFERKRYATQICA